MQKKHLNILLRDKDLFTENVYNNFLKNRYLTNLDNNLNPTDYNIKFEGNEYRISLQLFDVLKILFEWYLTATLEYEGQIFKQSLNEKRKIYSTSIQDQLILYNKLKVKEFDKLESLIGEITKENTVAGIASVWCFELLENENGPELIECLKFEVLKGENLSKFVSPFTKFPGNNFILNKYFWIEKLEKIYQSMAINENITYLQSLVDQLLQEKEKPFTHREEALIYKYKQDAKLVKELSAKEIRSKWNQNRYDAFRSIGFPQYNSGLSSSKAFRRPTITELENVFKIFSEFPQIQKKITNDIESLKK